MPLPTATETPPTPIIEPPPLKRPLVSRFDVEPVSLSMSKRFKTEEPKQSANPLSDSDSDSLMMEEIVVIDQTLTSAPLGKKKKKKSKSSVFQKYGEIIGQTNEELQRRDRRMQRFSEVEVRGTPPRVDTPDYVRDAQIAASIVRNTPPLCWERLTVEVLVT
jgi:hypothetical protein